MKYTLEQATQKVMRKNQELRKIVKQILDWDTDLTVIDLAKAFRLKRVTVYKFANRYKLDYARYGVRHKTNITELRQDFIRQMQEKKISIKDMAKVLGVKHQYISQIRTA